MKRVRMLLRVSSNQQLEVDGDLSVQRQIVTEYIGQHEDWLLDEKEYFEGSRSGYKNAVSKRETLQEALEDAGKREYDILAAYKDDRVGRRMWEMGAYIMALKSCGVDVYTVKDGCISPEADDIMGQMMLALRYGNAQKSSSDTGMRVKDTAQKLVQKGRFMGGAAPYGYELVLSGELSRHGRALHTLKIIPQQAETVKHIYSLSLNQEYGSVKIANILNEDIHYRRLAPRDVWKAGTITSILTNPVYAGYTAYKRRERMNGKYHRLDQSDWIIAEAPNEEIRIIEEEMWNQVQEKRKKRSDRYKKKPEDQAASVIRRNDGMLPLIDVIYCGYCGGKLTNGSRYHYWTIKGTGERRSSRTPMYRCRNGDGRTEHPAVQYHAERIERAVFQCLGEYIGRLLENEDAAAVVFEKQKTRKKIIETEWKKEEEKLHRLQKGIEVMEGKIPDAVAGKCAFTAEELAEAVRSQRKKVLEQELVVQRIQERRNRQKLHTANREEIRKAIPAWKQIFHTADSDTKRVLVQKIVERIQVTREQIRIRFKFSQESFNNGSP
ncbi:recombinase family protein [Lachnospiraceae bacterium]|nr:recombinase family protein [Lachnospiraceae bacterium]